MISEGGNKARPLLTTLSADSNALGNRQAWWKGGLQRSLSALTRTLRSFIDVNRRGSRFFKPYFPQTKLQIFPLYDKIVTECMNRNPGNVVVDVGGGKRCRFAKYREKELKTKIVSVDVSMREMQDNSDVDEKRVADVTHALPCTDMEADLLVSSSVLEHLQALPPFLRECARVLKHDGYFVHVFSCKFAPFALLNQALPSSISKLLLSLVFPGSNLGYRAFYDHCYPSAVRQLLESNGLKVQSLVVSYSQSDYFDFLLPVYLLSALYELAVWRLGLTNLCAYVLVVARKPAHNEPC
jgi:ubiquinone/menaquinone biosynthesis C-methylase UbiE